MLRGSKAALRVEWGRMEGVPNDLRSVLRQTAVQLASKEDLRSRADLDARQLIEIATGMTRVQQLAAPERLLAGDEVEAVALLVDRRLRAEPMQHLRGSQEFYGREFLVSPNVLIPRPETEDIVTAVLETVADRAAAIRVADVGTGSGALALTLALELPQAEVTALEISDAALAVAVQNAKQLGLTEAVCHGRVRLLRSDLFSAVEQNHRFDIIVSNPPYIPLRDAPTLHAEVRDYEPHAALFAGEDGMDIYRRLIPEAWQRLDASGLLVMETGGEIGVILSLLKDWADPRVRRDLQGISRVVSARRA